MDIEQNLRAYESDIAPEATIRKIITDAYGSLKPELETIHKYETEQMPTFYDAFSGYGMGTGAADMSPLARLQSASEDVARKSALARTARDVFGVNKASMEDLIGQSYRQWQSGYQGAQNAWQRQMAEKQLAAQKAATAAANRRINIPQSPGLNIQPVVSGVKDFLDSKVGGDGKVSPNTFQTAMNMFNNQLKALNIAPVSTQVFANAFQDYIDPTHGWNYIGMSRPENFQVTPYSRDYLLKQTLSGYGSWK